MISGRVRSSSSIVVEGVTAGPNELFMKVWICSSKVSGKKEAEAIMRARAALGSMGPHARGSKGGKGSGRFGAAAALAGGGVALGSCGSELLRVAGSGGGMGED